MANPVATARQDPGGVKMKDGYRCLITFANDPDIELWEVEVTPPGYDGGDAIDNTTMHNDEVEVFRSQALYRVTDSSFTAAWDPIVYTSLRNLINRETTVTHTFRDGSTYAAYGFLRVFQPDGLVRGTMPTASCEISYTNWDHVNQVEAVGTVVAVAGT